MKDVQNIFVYGSLRSGFRSDAYAYISKYFNLVSNGKVKGELYAHGDYPVAVPSTGENFITGELYRIIRLEELAWAIGQLDDYEGLNVEAHEKPMYRRELVQVYTDKEPQTAWVYWYNGDVNGLPRIESGDVLEYLGKKN